MNIQSPSQTGTRSGQRQGPESGSTGTVGMMRFNTDQSGAARGRHSSVGSLPANLEFSVSSESEQPQERQESLPYEFVRTPLSQIVALLSRSPLDGQALEEQLSTLYVSLVRQSANDSEGNLPVLHVLDDYFQALSDDQLGTLSRALQPERLEAAQAALPQNEGEPQEYQPLIMLVHLQASLERELYASIQPDLRHLQEKLDDAVRAGSRFAASQVLLDLNSLVDAIQQVYGWLPAEAIEDVRKMVDDSLGLFRDAESKPKSRLNEASLRKLDDVSFARLRQVPGLRFFGLELDLDAANKVGLERVEGLSRQLISGMKDVLQTLPEETADMRVLMSQLLDLSGLESQRTRELEKLGQFASGGLSEDGSRALARDICERVMSELYQAGRAAIVHNAMRHMDLFNSLESELGRVASGLESVVGQEDYKSGGMKIIKQLGTTRHLLSGMASALSSRLPDLLESNLSDEASVLHDQPLISPDSTAGGLPSVFYRALREQYGVAYDPVEGAATVLMTDSARAKLVSELEAAPSVQRPHALGTSAPSDNRTEMAVLVSDMPYRDAIGRGGIVFSAVRGVGADGQPIRYTRPDPIPRAEYVNNVESSLNVLHQLAGPVAEPLTRLLSQEVVGAAVLSGLQGMGLGSPFKLNDRMTAVCMDSEGRLEFDVTRNEDGSFRVATTVLFMPYRSSSGLRPGNTKVTMLMSPNTTSWAQVQFTLLVSPDAQKVRVIELPQFRHYFDVEEITLDYDVFSRRYPGPHQSSIFA